MLESADTAVIDKFIADAEYRGTILKLLSKFPINLIAGFISFLDKCLDATWQRSIPDGAFWAYNENLIIILDILTVFPFERFPPALFQSAAYALQRVGYYVGNEYGKSWEAHKTWESRKESLSQAIVQELRSVAVQYNYYYVTKLVDGN